jgi:nitroreductase
MAGDRNGTDSLFEAISTQRAIRKFRPDPLPDDLLWKVLEAATRAPSGSNSQPWGFIVVQDAGQRKVISEALAHHLEENEWLRNYFEKGSQSEDRSTRLMLGGALKLAHALAEAPALIIPCIYPSRSDALAAGSSIYPAVQNLLLAARGLGLGTVLTTFHSGIDKELRELLSLPEDAKPVALIPIGFPDANFGPTNRRPVQEVVHWGRWGATKARS